MSKSIKTNYIASFEGGEFDGRVIWMPPTKTARQSFDFQEWKTVPKEVCFFPDSDKPEEKKKVSTEVVQKGQEPIHHLYACTIADLSVTKDSQVFTYRHQLK